MSKRSGTTKRTLYYFWKTLMKFKARTFTILILIPVYVFIADILVPRGASEIIGKLSEGDFELTNYTGILMITLIPMLINNCSTL